MSLLDELPVGAMVGLDTAPIIYHFEGHGTYGPIILPFFEQRLEQGLNRAVTSVVSLAEVLVRPLAAGRGDLVQSYRDFLMTSVSLTLAELRQATAERAADLRVRYGIRLPDALQIAAALEHHATHFVTNDLGLRRVIDLKVLILQDYLPAASP